jgi:SAM-dependent methyltransferase
VYNSSMYYFGASYRRKMLDKLFEQNRRYFRGVVLDIGGKDRGKFKKPKDKVEKWIFGDIQEKNNPDIVLDVADMNQIESETLDIVLASELFEHVDKPEQGLRECHRVLKKGGTFIVSMPFMFQTHADPYDFQRWTDYKWKTELGKLGFEIEKFETMGRFFTVAMDMWRVFVRRFPFRPFRWICYPFYPLMDLITKLDKTDMVKSHTLGHYTTGYFIIARK